MKIFKSNLWFFLLILVVAGISNIGLAAEEEVTFYVSIAGNDNNSETIEQPFATLQAAKTAIRNGKLKGLTAPVEVILRGGTHYLEVTLELEPEDSGTPDAPVNWRTAENERVILR